MQFLGHDVYGKTLGICGLGRIGRGVARRARGFDMNVLYTDVARAPEAIERELGATFVDKDTLLRRSDIVTLHVPLVAATKHYLAARELALMKPSAIPERGARPVVTSARRRRRSQVIAASSSTSTNVTAAGTGSSRCPTLLG
jgi:glyoxylate reductase